MRKNIFFAMLGLGALALLPGSASAWWLADCCCHKCCVKLCAKQYNAFSPFCLDSLQGCLPLQGGCGNGGFCGGPSCGPACSYPDGGGYMGELPPASAPGAHVLAPSAQTPTTTTAGPAAYGVPMMAAPGMGAMAMPPSGVPSYYTGFTPSAGYAPAYGR